MNCDCINSIETQLLSKYQGAFQSCEAETLNNNFVVPFKIGIPNIREGRISIEVVYCPFCGKKVGE